ncbi:MAG: hypothetical protein PSW75_02040, partial [bacterium]|nr:hypothetical protein [bacterium]
MPVQPPLLFRFTCLLGGLALLPACYREATDSASAPRYTGTAPWTVDGVRPGQTLDEARKILGEPSETRGSRSARVVHWSDKETMVTINAANVVVEIWGHSLKAGGQTVVGPGLSEAEVTQTLGSGKSARTSVQGSGVISFGAKTTGRI